MSSETGRLSRLLTPSERPDEISSPWASRAVVPRGEPRATGQTSHGGSWLTTTAQGAAAGDRTLCSAYFWKHRDAWHPPGAASHSNKPRSSCHNIFPLEGAGVSVIATWCFLEAVLIPSPLSRLSQSSQERRTLGRAEAEGPGAADCPTQGRGQRNLPGASLKPHPASRRGLEMTDQTSLRSS